MLPRLFSRWMLEIVLLGVTLQVASSAWAASPPALIQGQAAHRLLKPTIEG